MDLALAVGLQVLTGVAMLVIVSLGLAVVFGMMRVINLAHGEFMMLGAFAAGTIVNPLTARSQYMGGMIWGLSAALLEATEIDPHAARYVNDNLSEYHIPVSADVEKVDVIFVPERDEQVNPLGIKGIGELGIVGMNAAVANAVFHATGRRVRDLPIRLDDLL